MIETTGKLYSFGLGANGQLGTSTTTNQKIPAPVHGGWLSSTTLQEEGDLIDFGTPVDLVPLAEHGFVVKRVFAGGDQSFASVIVNKMGAKVRVHVDVPSCSFFLPSFFSLPLPPAPLKILTPYVALLFCSPFLLPFFPSLWFPSSIPDFISLPPFLPTLPPPPHPPHSLLCTNYIPDMHAMTRQCQHAKPQPEGKYIVYLTLQDFQFYVYIGCAPFTDFTKCA